MTPETRKHKLFGTIVEKAASYRISGKEGERVIQFLKDEQNGTLEEWPIESLEELVGMESMEIHRVILQALTVPQEERINALITENAAVLQTMIATNEARLVLALEDKLMNIMSSAATANIVAFPIQAVKYLGIGKTDLSELLESFSKGIPWALLTGPLRVEMNQKLNEMMQLEGVTLDGKKLSEKGFILLKRYLRDMLLMMPWVCIHYGIMVSSGLDDDEIQRIIASDFTLASFIAVPFGAAFKRLYPRIQKALKRK